MILENSKLPEGVSIDYKSICKNRVEGTGENGRKCSNISIGDEVLFVFCLSDSFLSGFGRLSQTDCELMVNGELRGSFLTVLVTS